MHKAKDVDSYIVAAPLQYRAKLKQLRALIKSSAPGAIEKISYGMPYYGYHGRLAYFLLAKEHIGLYIMPKVLKKYESDVRGYRTGKATIRLELDEKLPVALIKKLVKASVKMNSKSKA